MRRRAFITMVIAGFGGSKSTPALAQQNVPLVGFLSSRSEGESEQHLRSFREGLREKKVCRGPECRV